MESVPQQACVDYVDRLPIAAEERRSLLSRTGSRAGTDPRDAVGALHGALGRPDRRPANPAYAVQRVWNARMASANRGRGRSSSKTRTAGYA
jgi:hypothetical protein